MKKLLPLIAVFCLLFSACGGDPAEDVSYTYYNHENWFASSIADISSADVNAETENTKNFSKTNADNTGKTAKTADKSKNKPEITNVTEITTQPTAGKSKRAIITPVKSKNKKSVKSADKTKSKALGSGVSYSSYLNNQNTKREGEITSALKTNPQNKTSLQNIAETDLQTKTTVQENIQTTTLAPLSDTDICYITKTGSRYHRQGCRYLSKSCIEIIVGEAKEKGYQPCQICKP